jgi:hypothetical protein
MENNKYDAGATGLRDAGPAEFSDEGTAHTRPGHRRWPWVAAVLALAVAAVAGGVAVAGNMGPAEPAPAAVSTGAVVAPTASGAITTTPSPTVATSVPVPASAPATSGTPTQPSSGVWRTFASADSKVSFDYPGSWSVAPAAGASGYAGTAVDVADESGAVVASMSSGPGGGLGGACQGQVPYTVLDTVEVDLPHQPSKGSVTPRFVFRALQEADHVTASYGLTNSLAGQNGTTCMFYNVVTGPADPPMYSFADAFQVNAGGSEQIPNHKGAKTFPSMDAARAYMQTPEYLNAKRMITSLKIAG